MLYYFQKKHSAYLMLFLITMIGFTSFGVAYSLPQFRLTICSLLIVTTINFTWTISATLPSVAYLTFFDNFSLGGLLVLAAVYFWDAFVGSGLISSPFTEYLEPIAIFVLIGAFVLFLTVMLFDLIKVELCSFFFLKKCELKSRQLGRRKKLFYHDSLLDTFLDTTNEMMVGIRSK
jgi:hypothetical protein